VKYDILIYAAKELIEELLKTDPDKRLSIHQVMKHKWIAVNINCSYKYKFISRGLQIVQGR